MEDEEGFYVVKSNFKIRHLFGSKFIIIEEITISKIEVISENSSISVSLFKKYSMMFNNQEYAS